MKTPCWILVNPLIPIYYKLSIMILMIIFFPVRINAQWNNDTFINLEISGLAISEMQSVSTSDGKTWIAFYHENNGNYELWAQLLDINGYKLLETNGMLVSSQTSGTDLFGINLCLDNTNNLVIACQDQRNGTLQAVLYKISQAGAQLWNPAGVIVGSGYSPYPCPISNNETAVVWNDTEYNTLRIVTLASDGTVFQPAASFQPITVDASNTVRGQIVENYSGFTVVFQVPGEGISSTLYSLLYTNTNEFGFYIPPYLPLKLSDQLTYSDRYYSLVAENDTTYVGYHCVSGTRTNSFLQRINPDGTIPWGMNGSNFNTSVGQDDHYQGLTQVNFATGSDFVWSVCTFSTPDEIMHGVYIQKFLKTTGARQFTDAAKIVYPISTSNNQQGGSLALVDDTPMFISYNADYKIYATRLDGDGNFVWPGNSVELSSTTTTSVTPKILFNFTAEESDQFAVIWSENRGINYLGYAQGITSGGLVGIDVFTQGDVPPVINTEGGTLQMEAMVIPSTANQSVTWSIIPGTGAATIDTTGLMTAQSNGTVWAKATSVQDTFIKDSLMITMSEQPMPPAVTTLAATNIQSDSTTLNGTVIAYNSNTTVSFEWGLTTSYGNSITLHCNWRKPDNRHCRTFRPGNVYDLPFSL